MSEQQRPLFDKRNSSTSSVLSGGNGNDNSNTTTDRDTSSNDEQAQATHQPSRHHHPKKHQFVVGGAHSRHHTRVPSYGRNLNKLGKLAPLATSPGSGKARGEEKGRSSAKRATFELGGDNRQNSNGNSRPSSYKEEGGYTNGNATNTSNGTPPPTTVATNKGTNGLVKSSSTKSLDRKPRDGARRLKREEKRERSQSKSRDTVPPPPPPASRQHPAEEVLEMNNKRQSEAQPQTQTQFQLPTPPQPEVQPPPPQQQQKQQHQSQHFQSQHPSHAPTHLLPHTKPSGAAPPKVSVESVQAATQPTVSTKIRRTTAQQNGAYVTPAHSLPDAHEQPLTSRFIDSSLGNSNSISPSSAAKAYGLSRSYRENLPTIGSTTPDKAPVTPVITSPNPASTTATVPSRTQQKLWLQRQSSQHEAPQHVQNQTRLGPGSEWYALQPRAQKEFERVNREYLNTRRFKNPAAQSIERIRNKHSERRIPKRKEGQSADGAGTMGLSQSLKETGATKSVRKELKIGSKDDSGVKQTATVTGRERDKMEELQAILMKLWTTAQMLPSNE